ncbi:MAG: nucleoside hydrolase [Promethearchaeota archaeon]
MSENPTRIIIDTDLALGEFMKDVDDGLAIVMALNSPELNVVAISGVYGNTTLKKVSGNVPRLLSRFPEKEKLPEYIEGAESYRDWMKKTKLPGITRLRKVVEENAPVTMVPIGPLTNIALLFYHYPEILKNNWVEKLVIMGGCLDKWEFNFANDPASTDYVLQLPIPTVICGYETCMAQKFTRDNLTALELKKTSRSNPMIKEIKGWLKLNEMVMKKGESRGFYPFDPVAIAYVLRPDLFESDKIPVTSTNVDKKKYKKFDFSTKTYVNQDVLDQKESLSDSEKLSWVDWTMKIDSDKFMELLMERLF